MRLVGDRDCIALPSTRTICRSTFPGAEDQEPVLLLGHFDTVYPLGTLSTMPCHTQDGRLYGPGVLDMKSGIALMMYAIQALANLAWNVAAPHHCVSGL